MCYRCGNSYPTSSCGCQQSSCDDSGCITKLDFKCVLYHKDNNSMSNLTGLNLNNGATLELVIESIDLKIRQLDVNAWSLTYLRPSYTITNLRQFGEAIDDEFQDLQTQITALAQTAAVPLVATDSTSIDFTQNGTLDHNVTAAVKISASTGNRASILSDGVFVTPQTLSADYDAKKISIAGGNTIDMLNFCGCDDCFGYLGEVTDDPVDAINGNYWWRSDVSPANGLKIRVAGVIRTIPTT